MAAAGARRMLVMFTKPDCMLCEEAKDIIYRVADKVPLMLREVNLERPENAAWRQKYFYDIPVVHLNGSEIFRHRTTQEKLEQALGITQPPTP